PGRAEQRRRKHPVERVGGEHAAYAGEPRRRAVGPEPETGPALLRGGTRRQEEHRRRRLAARHDQQPRILGLELRQVEEGIGLTEIVVLDVVTLEVPLVRGGNERDAAADAGRERAPPQRDGRRVDRAAHAGQFRDGSPGPDRLDGRERRRIRATLRAGAGGARDGDDDECEGSHGPGSYRARWDAAT